MTNTQSDMSEDNLSKIISVQSHLLDANISLDDFMNLVVNETRTLTKASGVVIELAESGEMIYRAATGTMEGFIGMHLAMKGSISGLCVESRQVLISDDTETDPRVNLEACRKVKARSLVVAPLFNNGNAVGVLKIMSDKPKAFTVTDVKMLQIMAGLLGSALARKILDEMSGFFLKTDKPDIRTSSQYLMFACQD